MTKPYPFQLEGVERMEAFNGRALLADEMGLGKSLEALLFAQRNDKLRPVVVVCPASLKENWRREAAKHVRMPAVVLSGTKPNVDPKFLVSPILIINYDILTPWLPFLRSLNPKLVICDEAHALQGRSTKRTKAVQMLCHGVPGFLALTGTPLTNRPANLWPILNLINPRLYPSFWNYAREFCNLKRTPWGWDWSGASNLPKLHQTLLNTCMIRRKKSEVLSQLPPMQRIVMPVEITDRRQYETATKDFMSWMMKYSPTSLKTAQKAEGLVKIGYLLRLTATLKLPVIREWIDNFLEGSDEKLTVYGIHRKIVESLHETYGKNSVLVHGGITGNSRQRAVDQFQRDAKTRLFIGNVKAAGVGLTLTAAATVANIEFGWVPGDHIQAENRVSRIGQTKAQTSYWIVGRDTIEERLVKVLQNKQQNIDAVVDGDDEVNQLDVYDQLIDELRKDTYHAKKHRIHRRSTKRHA